MKSGIRRGACQWVQDEARAQLRSGVPAASVHINLRMSNIKGKFLDWLADGMTNVADNTDAIKAGWAAGGYPICWDSGCLPFIL